MYTQIYRLVRARVRVCVCVCESIGRRGKKTGTLPFTFTLVVHLIRLRDVCAQFLSVLSVHILDSRRKFSCQIRWLHSCIRELAFYLRKNGLKIPNYIENDASRIQSNGTWPFSPITFQFERKVWRNSENIRAFDFKG